MVGLTLGIVLSMSEKTVQQFTQSQLIYLVALVSLITLVILFVHRFLNNSHDPFFVVMIVLGAMGYFVLKVLNSVESSQSFVKPNDYLILSDHYITSGNYARAADYLKKYKEIESYDLSKAISDSLDKHIDALYLRGIQQLK